MGSFMVLPPESATYVLKIYAGPEQMLEDSEGTLDHVVSFSLVCEKVRHTLVTAQHETSDLSSRCTD